MPPIFISSPVSSTNRSYTLYDVASMKELDGGQLDMPELSRMKAVLQICDDNDLGKDSVKYAPLSMIETLQEAAYKADLQARSGRIGAASSQLPEAQEQALDEYPMPDEQVSTPDMQEYGYSYDGMLPVTRERVLELDAAGLTVYVLHEDNTESVVALTHREIDGAWRSFRCGPMRNGRKALSSTKRSWSVRNISRNENRHFSPRTETALPSIR